MTDVQWYIQIGAGKKAGPVPFERLQALARQGKIFPTTKVRSTDENAVWTPAQDIADLFKSEPPEAESKPETEEHVDTEEAVAEPVDATEPRVEETPAETSLEESAVEADSVQEFSEELGLPVEDSSSVAISIPEDMPVEKTSPKADGIPKIAISINTGKDKPTPKAAAFVIDTGKGGAKKDDAPKAEQKTEPKEAVQEPIKETKKADDASKSVKIGLGALGAKKKSDEPSSDSSSKAVKIDLGGVGKKKEDDASSVSPVVKPDEAKEEKASDKSAGGVKISIGGTKKTKESKIDKKSDKSAGAFKIDLGAKPDKMEKEGAADEPAEEEATAADVKKKEKKESPAEKAAAPKTVTPKKGGSGFAVLLKAASVLAFLAGLGGSGGVFWLLFQEKNIALASALGSVLLIFGVVLGLVAWGLAAVFGRFAHEENEVPKD